MSDLEILVQGICEKYSKGGLGTLCYCNLIINIIVDQTHIHTLCNAEKYFILFFLWNIFCLEMPLNSIFIAC